MIKWMVKLEEKNVRLKYIFLLKLKIKFFLGLNIIPIVVMKCSSYYCELFLF